MIAAMISKVIGLLYKSPLSNIIGSLGMGYTSLAQNAYMILLMIASFSIPQAVSKLISERIALKDYRNAHKFFKGAMIYAMVIGGVVGLFCLFGAGLIIPQNQKDAIPALQILAPTIFLSGILGVFRGYFQAYRNMMPTSISQIIEQVFNAVISIVGASVLFGIGTKAGKKSGEELLGPAYGAAGSTLGTVVGSLSGLLFLLFVIFLYKNVIRKQLKRDRTQNVESYSFLLKALLLTAIPVVFSTAVYNINQIIDLTIFNHVMESQGYVEKEYMALQGIYTGKYDTLINVPMAIANALGTSLVPSLTAVVTAGTKKQVHSRLTRLYVLQW